MQHRRGNEAHNAALEAEHWLAWFLSALAILLAVLGLLRAYGIIGPENTTAAGQVTSISPGGLPDTYWDGGLLLLAALSSALLAFAIIGVVTGYNKDGGHHWQPDGIPWLLTSIGAAILANVLHSVQHHQLAHEEHGTQRTGTEGFVQERRGELSETPPTRSQR